MARAVSLLLVLAACGGTKSKSIDNQTPGSGSTVTGSYTSCEKIEGNVVSATDQPLQGVTVQLSGGNDESDYWITDKDGAFSITPNVRRDTLRVMYRKEDVKDVPFAGCVGLRVRYDGTPAEL